VAADPEQSTVESADGFGGEPIEGEPVEGESTEFGMQAHVPIKRKGAHKR
jgi:hypothetical protein